MLLRPLNQLLHQTVRLQIAQSSNGQLVHATVNLQPCRALVEDCAQSAIVLHQLHVTDVIKHLAQYAHLPKQLHEHCGQAIDLAIYLALPRH